MNTVTINGKSYSTGWQPTPAETMARMHRYGRLVFSHDHPKLRAAAGSFSGFKEERDCRHFFAKHKKDQGSQSACTGASGAHVMIGTLAKEGFDVDVCYGAIYALINGGRDAGANIGECMEALQTVGCVPVGFQGLGDRDWSKARSIMNTIEFKAEAGKLLLTESVLCSTVDEFYAGLESGGWCGQIGLGAGSNFETDEYGFLPLSGPRAGINHALCATGGFKRHPKTGEWGIEGDNTWGTDWGLDGFFYATDKWVRVNGQELWLARASLIPAQGGVA